MTTARLWDREAGAPPAPEFAGTERFELVRRLGRGGFGDVYEARDRELGRSVALKVLRRTTVRDLQSFKREFRGLADVRHPGLVQLLELHRAGDTWFFTMELVRGRSLRNDVWRHEPTPGLEALGERRVRVDRARVVNAIEQLVDAVSFLHGTGRVHRDIKPPNVLVEDTGRVVLLDFGLVTMIGGTVAGFAGTPGYAAPELLAGERATPRADWFSVGVLLHELATGTRSLSRDVAFEIGPTPITVTNPEEVEDLAAAARELCATRRPEVLAAALGVASAEHPRPLAPRPPVLLGRASQLAQLQQAYDEVLAGEARIVLLHGPSGIGKSHLLAQFVAGLDAATVLAGACHERERIPFRAFDGVIDDLVGVLSGGWASAAISPEQALAAVRVFPALGAVLPVASAPRAPATPDVRELRSQAFTALRALLASVARHVPLVIAIDDLQWGDHDSAQLFAELTRPPLAGALFLFGARGDGSPALPEWWEPVLLAREVTDVAVPPLAPGEITELVRALGDASTLPDETARRIAAESQGNPYFVHQLVARAARGEPSSTRIPTVQQVVLDEILDLPTGARWLAEGLALVARPVDGDTALALAPEPETARGALAELQHAQLVSVLERATGTLVSLRHDRVREALVAAIPSHQWNERHRHVARVLEQRGPEHAEPGLLSALYSEAGDLAAASVHAEAAAERAAQAFAFHQAAELYAKALEWCTDGARRAQLRPRLADALANAGRGASAAPLYQQLAADRGDLEASALRRRAVEAYLTSGHLEAGLRELSELGRTLELPFPSSPGRAFTAALALMAKLRLRGGPVDPTRRPTPREQLQMDTCYAAAKGLIGSDAMRGSYFALRALDLALASGDRARAARYRSFVGAAILAAAGGALGRWGKTMLAEAAREVAASDDPLLAATHDVCSAQTAILDGAWSAALERSDRALELLRTRCKNVAWEKNFSQMGALRALEELGRLAEARTRVDGFLRAALDEGDVYAEVTARLFRGVHRLALHDLDGARVDANLALGMWTHHGYHVQHLYALRIHLFADLYEGLPDRAWRRLESEWSRIDGSFLMRVPTGRIDVMLMRGRAALALALAASDATSRRRLLPIAERAARLLAREPRPDAGAHGLVLRAAASTLRGERATAIGLLTTAEARFTALGMRLCAAYAAYRREQLEGTAPGAAAEVMRGEGIASPERWLAVHAPGFA